MPGCLKHEASEGTHLAQNNQFVYIWKANTPSRTSTRIVSYKILKDLNW